MSRDGALRPAPEDLGQAADIDSFAIEPGVILLERFCALDRVQRGSVGWSVPITDLKRQLGNTPHHRLRLEFLRAGDADERKLRRGVRLMSEVQSVVHGWIRARDGVLLLTDIEAASPSTPPLTESESAIAGVALTATLSQLHGSGVIGVGFSPDALLVTGRDVKVIGYEHLLTGGTAEEDVHRLADLLEFLSGGALSETVRPTPTTAVELWERLRNRRDGAGAGRLSLPATPPFVGREEILARMTDAARHARGGQAQVILVRGEAGMGRTRLLRRLEVEVDRWVDALVTSGRFKVSAPGSNTGFVEVLEALARQPTSLGSTEHDALRDRIRATAGPLLGMVAALDPAISQWLGTIELPSNLQLSERFGQHAATLAAVVRAVGTPRRPLIVLLDDVDHADPGSRAVLQELMAGPAAHHTMVVATCTSALEGLPRGPVTVTNLEIGPLDRVELRELLDRSMPGPVADREMTAEALWQVSRGQPQVAWGALQEWALRDAWVLDDGVGAWRLRSERIEGALARDPYTSRWLALPPHQQWLVLIAALRAGRSTIRWLVEVTSWNETEVRNAVQASVDAALVVAEPDGGLRFVNDTIRGIVEQTVTDEVRANAHRQIADWLDRQPGSSQAQRAWHRELARQAGRDERLAELHVRGGQELLAIYDIERARWHFDKAMTRATAPTIWVDALEGRADVALLEGRTDAALDDYLQGMTYGGDPIRGLEIAAKAIQGFHRKDAPQAAYDLAAAALRLAGEPLPVTWVGKAVAVVGAVAGLWRRSPASTRVRDALCRVYAYLMGMMITERPFTAVIGLLRGVRHARGLDSENAAAVLAMYGAFRAAIGSSRAGTRLMDEAEAVARRSQKPWGLGLVSHMRAQVEVADGQYQRATDSLDRAVEQFRAAGDLAIAVYSYTMRAFYGKENQPVSRILEWVREAESCNRRQGSRLGIHATTALRVFALARRKPADAREEAMSLSRETLAIELGTVDLSGAHALLAGAFVHLGQPGLAWTHAKESLRRMQAGRAAADFMLDAYVAVAATVLATPQPTVEQERALRKSLRALARHGRRAPRLRAAWGVYSAMNAMRRARVDEATDLLEEVIAQHPVHQQAWYALEAHRLLARLRHAVSVAEADQHRQQAHALAVALELEDATEAVTAAPTPAPAPVAPAPPPRLEAVETDAEPQRALPPVRVEPLIRRLLPAFERALARRVSLRVDIAAEAQVECNPESLQLLVVNLVLAARDSLRQEGGEIRLTVKSVRLDQADSARLPGARADAHLLIEARAMGPRRSDSISGVGICSEITTSIGGFLDVRAEGSDALVLAAYLVTRQAAEADTEATASGGEEVVVVHSDQRIRQTVVSALRDLGMRAEGMDPELYADRLVGGDRLVFGEAEWLAEQPRIARTVKLYPRGTPAPDGPSLRVPFTIGELQDVVGGVTSPDSSG